MEIINNEEVKQNDILYVNKSKKHFIFLIAAVLTVALISGLVYLFIKGNGNLTYRQAERNLIASLAGKAVQDEIEYNASDFEIILQPSDNIFSGINPTVFKGGAVYDNGKIYGELSYLNGNKNIISALMYLTENTLYFGLPNISDYIFKTEITDGEIEANQVELDKSEAYNTLNTILNIYFDKIDNEASEKNTEVSYEGITKRCDRYTVIIDKESLRELFSSACNTLLQNQNLIDYINEKLNINLDEFINEMLSALDSVDYSDSPDFKIKMDAYVSGNDIIKRDFSIISEETKADLSVISIDDGKKYAQCISATAESDTYNNFIFKNTGTISNGKKSGFASFEISDLNNDLSRFSINLDYTDYAAEKNGMFSGIFKLEAPEVGFKLDLTASTDNDEMKISGSMNASYEHILDIDIYLKLYKDKKITFDGENAYSINDSEKSGEYYNILSNYFNDIYGMLVDENGNYDLLGYAVSLFSISMFGGISDYDFDFDTSIIGGADGPTAFFTGI